MPRSVARKRRDDIELAGFFKMRFAWAGADQPGKGHYYRIEGPTFLIEFCNTQPDSAGNPANHIHSVWRDKEGDFGISIKPDPKSRAAARQSRDSGCEGGRGKRQIGVGRDLFALRHCTPLALAGVSGWFLASAFRRLFALHFPKIGHRHSINPFAAILRVISVARLELLKESDHSSLSELFTKPWRPSSRISLRVRGILNFL